MYKTNYFKNIQLGTIKAVISSVQSGSRTLKNENSEISGTFLNSIEWEGQAKKTLATGFNGIESRLDIINAQLTDYLEAIEYADRVVTIQKEMESSTDINVLLTDAKTIEDYMNKIKSCVTSMENAVEGVNELVNSVASNEFGTGIFQNNQEKFRVTKDEFNSWSNLLKDNYDSYLSMENAVSLDAYLYYAWGLVCAVFDKLATKRDSMDSWLENFIVNLKTTEDGLPENVAALTKVSVTTIAKTHKYPSKPSFDSYLKSGQKGEIKGNSTSSNKGTASTGATGGTRTNSDKDKKVEPYTTSKQLQNMKETHELAKEWANRQKKTVKYTLYGKTYTVHPDSGSTKDIEDWGDYTSKSELNHRFNSGEIDYEQYNKEFFKLGIEEGGEEYAKTDLRYNTTNRINAYHDNGKREEDRYLLDDAKASIKGYNEARGKYGFTTTATDTHGDSHYNAAIQKKNAASKK